MTDSEAIKKHIDECKNRIEIISFFMSSNSDANKEECCNNTKILQIAINALEKQIPKKPIPIDYKKYMDVVNNAISLRGGFWCPNCKKVVRSGSYCNDCGQKLDWSDEE